MMTIIMKVYTFVPIIVKKCQILAIKFSVDDFAKYDWLDGTGLPAYVPAFYSNTTAFYNMKWMATWC